MSSDKSNIIVPSSRPPTIREIHLINRVKEMHLLREAADKAVRGEGGIIFLHGEAGIGKTRLARELGAYARLRGMQVLSGRCPALFRMDGIPPYVLWEEIIRDYLEVCTPEQLFRVIGSYPIEVSKLVPELTQKLRTFPQSFPLNPQNERNRLFEAVSQFISNISREAPLLVILDDLQWTDQSSLLLLHYLAQGVYKESLLLLGAYRHTYIDEKHPLSSVLAELNRERLLQSVPLKRMSFDDVSEMIKRILEQDKVPRDFCEMIYEKTRGNPFFVEEVIRSLKEEETICLEENRWKVRGVSRIEFPKTVRSVIKKRISRLDEESQNVLTMASFIGKDFTFDALHAVTGVEEDKLLEIMDKTLKAGFIKQRVIHGEDVSSFTDILVRDVGLEEVSPLKRKKLHGIVGKALEKVYAEKIDAHLGELALHFLESGDKEKALGYFLRAGEKAAEVYANNEAASNLQSALQLLEEKEGELPERANVLEKIGDIKNLGGEFDACRRYWNEAEMLWWALHKKKNSARLHRKMAHTLWDQMGDTEEAEEKYNKALKILETEPESVELASLYEDMAHMYYRIGDTEKARFQAQKALELAKKLNAHKVIASSYTSLGTIFSFTGDREKSVECHEKALKIALDNNYMETALRTYNNLASALTSEENERIFEYNDKGFELAKKVGHITYQSWIAANSAQMYLNMGNVDKALLLAEESVVLDRKTSNIAHLPMALNGLGYVYQVQGEWDRSEQYYKEALKIAEELNDFQAIGFCYWIHGWFNFNKGEYVKARELYEKALHVFKKAGAKYYEAIAKVQGAFTCIELGETSKAMKLIDNVQEFALEVKDRELILSVDGLRGVLFRALKNWEKSIEHFKKSIREAETLKARRWSVYTFAKMVLSEYARVYLERDQKGDREKARSLLNEALEIFQRMGAKKDIEKTRSKLIYLKTESMTTKPEPEAAVSLPSHVATGHKELDNLLYGGIPKNYTVILTSPSCDERDLLIKRFLEAGTKKGQVVFHLATNVTSEIRRLAENLQSNFYLFICNPQADKIMKSQPNVFKLKGVENLTDINIALSSAFRKLGASIKSSRRICIKIVSDVLLQHHAVQARRWLNALLPELKSKGFTTLAIMDPEMHAQQEVRAILGLFEGEINLYKNKSQKFLKIERMTNQKYSDSELPLEKGTL
ncbi:MAG: tetratricopeptide repeat protein [Candidatus Bathyarchaeota archaeon]|nr:MAG: tetratricopeptide repeat protein [Candidatus Bathyarchaeota archaeon]